MREVPAPRSQHALAYRCELCGKVYVVPSLARDCENADLDDPSRLAGDNLSHTADAETP